MPKKIRLGQRMEYFMEAALQSHPDYSIMAKNLQIISDKVTVGELDFLLKDLRKKQTVHLEMAYKFYLYDPSVSQDWQKCWIGTDRGDSLFKKIEKLKIKQLPLFHQKETKPYLDELNIEPQRINQQIYLKGQLFLRYQKNVTLNPILNQGAIAGYWLRPADLKDWKDQECLFYIPKKNRWIEELRDTTVKWLSYLEGIEQITHYLQKNYAAMLWVKSKNGILKRFMIVKWE